MEMPMNGEGTISMNGRDEHGFFSRRGEWVLFVLVSLMAASGEGFLIFVLAFARGSSDFPIAKYMLLLFHLLPWLAALRGMQRAKIALSQGRLRLDTMHESNGRVLSMLRTTYFALGATEMLLMMVYAHR